ncbi:MAG: hypothetical protein F6K30_21195 [Cyanothece sp. SIO2G6]|nr:hypothetical protein [Cyanothece sp. SIO2G6]
MLFSFYCLGAMVSSYVWLSAFLRDETTPNSDVFSWIIVAIATVSWPLSVPLALKELHSRKSKLAETDRILEEMVDQQYI